MILRQKTEFAGREGQVVTIKLPDFSNIIDIDVYKGGYEDLYYDIHYTYDVPNENKEVSLIYYYGRSSSSEQAFLDSRYKFFKVVDYNSKMRTKIFIFTIEKYSTAELRDTKIATIL